MRICLFILSGAGEEKEKYQLAASRCAPTRDGTSHNLFDAWEDAPAEPWVRAHF